MIDAIGPGTILYLKGHKTQFRKIVKGPYPDPLAPRLLVDVEDQAGHPIPGQILNQYSIENAYEVGDIVHDPSAASNLYYIVSRESYALFGTPWLVFDLNEYNLNTGVQGPKHVGFYTSNYKLHSKARSSTPYAGVPTVRNPATAVNMNPRGIDVGDIVMLINGMSEYEVTAVNLVQGLMDVKAVTTGALYVNNDIKDYVIKRKKGSTVMLEVGDIVRVRSVGINEYEVEYVSSSGTHANLKSLNRLFNNITAAEISTLELVRKKSTNSIQEVHNNNIAAQTKVCACVSVLVGFTSDTWACKHCGKDMPKPTTVRSKYR